VSNAHREAILNETLLLQNAIHALSTAVKSYRDFLERERTRFRGMLRVGRYLVDTSRTEDAQGEAAAILAGFEQAFAAMEARDRAPRKRAVRESVAALRQALDGMNGRLTGALGKEFTKSLYPALAPGNTEIVDDDDIDDDATRTA
jgi:hypothetical protein